MTDLNKLVLGARLYLRVSGDKKAWAEEAEMRALIAAGAKVIRNYRQDNGSHVTEVIFKNIPFTHTSKHSLIPTTRQVLH